MNLWLVFALNVLLYALAFGSTLSLADTYFKIEPNEIVRNRRGATSVSIGNKMIVWGGLADVVNGDVTTYERKADGAVYDFDTKKWTYIPAPADLTPRDDHTAVAVGKEMLIWGGLTYNHPRDTNPRLIRDGGIFNIETGEWRVICKDWLEEDCPSWSHRHAAVAVGDKAVFYGGSDGYGNFDNNDRFLDMPTATWKISQRGHNSLGPAGFVIDDVIYYVGGTPFTPNSYLLEKNLVPIKYDFSKWDEWESMPVDARLALPYIPGQKRYKPATAVIGKKALVMFGEDKMPNGYPPLPNSLNDGRIFDGATGQWSDVPAPKNLEDVFYIHRNAVLNIKGKFVIWDNRTFKSWAFDPLKARWIYPQDAN